MKRIIKYQELRLFAINVDFKCKFDFFKHSMIKIITFKICEFASLKLEIDKLITGKSRQGNLGE